MSNANEPLLSYASPRRRPTPPPSLFPLPEDNEVSIPVSSLTPSELKDRLIFGPPNDSTPIVDALTQSLSALSPRHNTATTTSSANEAAVSIDPLTPSACLNDPSFPFHRSNLHRSKTAPAMAVINDLSHPVVSAKPNFNPQSIVRQGSVLLLIYLSLGVVIYSFNRDKFRGEETHPVVDALYFCIVTMCTIGYGDITPTSTATKLFSILFVLFGFGFIDILLSGMVSYVLDLQENYLLRTAKGGYFVDVKKGRMRIRMKVALALGVVVLCIGVGVAVMHFVERLGWLDSIYLSVMSVTTVGYGDHAFESLAGRIFASIWLLVSTLAVARAFLYLTEARVDKRHRMMAKWVLGQDMTVSEFLAADIDNNGFVSPYPTNAWKVFGFILLCFSTFNTKMCVIMEAEFIPLRKSLVGLRMWFRSFRKSEYVIYKLKEMGKISEKDMMQICKQFDRLDPGNNGKITLTDLLESK